MQVASHCPDASVLQRFTLGQMQPEEVERLARHVEQCERCTRVLDGLKVADTLVEAMSAQATAGDEIQDASVVALIERLKGMPSPQSAHAEPMPASSSETPSADLGPSETPPPAGSGDPRRALEGSGDQRRTLPDAAGHERHDFLAPPQAPDEIGRLGGYRVLQVLGSGGMGIVFLAEDVQLRRRVALKTMRAEVAANATARQRFLREARAMAAVKCDHIATIYQVGEERGTPFLAMEFLQGEAMDDWLERGRRPTLAQVLRLAREMVLGLVAAQEHGLIHRDIKPGNIWLEAPTGRVKILDFGLARAADESRADDAHLTQSGAIVGTPAFMSPEQARGEHVDHRTDLFSLGCVLYQLTTGRLPFRGKTRTAVLSSLLVDTPEYPRALNPSLPGSLSDLIMVLLAKNPADRPVSAKAVLAAIQAIERESKSRAGARSEPSPSAVPVATPVKFAQPMNPWANLEQSDDVVVARPPDHVVVAAARESVAEVSATSATVRRFGLSRRFRVFLAAAVALALVGTAAYFFGGTVIRIATNKGELVIETDDKDVEVTIRREGEEPQVTLIDKHGKREFVLKAGDYKLEVTEKPGGLHFETEEFSITCGGKKTINVHLERTAAAARKTKPPEATGPPTPKETVRIEPAALLPMRPGEPISAVALVQRPAKLPGVRSWSIVTRGVSPTCPLAYRPDGKRLAVGSWDGTIRIYDVQTGRLVQVLLGESTPLFSLAWSPNGRVLAGGSQATPGRPVQLWEAETGRLLRALESQSWTTAHAVAWSKDGRTVLAVDGFGAGLCHAWNVADGKLLCKFNIACSRPVFAPDARRVAGVRDRAVFIWDTQTGKEVRKLGGHEGHLAWSPDGKRLACAGAVALYVWDAATGEEIIKRKDLANEICCLWAPDSRTLALTRRDNKPLLMLELSGARAKERQLETFAADAVWSPDGKTLALMGEANRIDLYDVATSKRVRTVCEARWALHVFAWSPDGKLFAALDAHDQAFLASADSGEVLAELKETTGPFAWSPDGKRLAAAGRDRTVILWDSGGKEQRKLTGHRAKVTALAWSPDGKRLASSATGEKRVLVWDADKLERPREVGPFTADVGPQRWHWFGQAMERYLMWSPHGKLLAFNVPEVGWHLWDVEQNRLANDPKQWKVAHFDFAPDGRNALVYSQPDGAYQLRDLATREERGRLPCAQTSPVWSPDGRLLVVAWGSQIELWSGDLRRRVRTMMATYKHLTQVAISSDGRLVAALNGERLHIWETATGRLRGIMLLGLGQAGLTVAPDGRYAGSDQAEQGVLMVVQKDDGTSEVLEPAEFERKYDFKNDPDEVHLLQPPPPPLPLEPMSQLALVQEPAKLPGVRSWTIATRDAFPSNLALPLAYRPDGKRLAAGSWDGSVRIFDTETGRLVQVLLAESGPLMSLVWSPNGRVLAGGSQSDERRPVHLWDPETGRLLRTLESPNPATGSTLAWSVGGRHLLASDHLAGVCRAWDATDGKLLRTVAIPCEWHYLSPEGRHVAGFRDRVLSIWDTETGQLTRKLGKYEGLLAWSQNGKRLACAGTDALHAWEVDTGKEVLHRKDLAKSFAPQWSPDGGTLALAQGPNHLFSLLELAEADARAREFEIAAWGCTWSPDGRTVAIMRGFSGGAVDLLDVTKGKRLRSLCESRRGIQGFAWSSDARALAVHNGHAQTLLASADTGRISAELKETAPPLAWSPDGKRLAAAGPNHNIVLWESGGKVRRTLSGLKADVGALAWSPDSKQLASVAAGEKRVLVWQAETGERHEVGPFATEVESHPWLWGNRGIVRYLSWSPDGRLLAFNSTGAGWHVWDVKQNRLANDPKKWKVANFEFAPDGRSALVYIRPTGDCQLRDLVTGETRGKQPPRSGLAPVGSPGDSDQSRDRVVACRPERSRPDADRNLSVHRPGRLLGRRQVTGSPGGRAIAHLGNRHGPTTRHHLVRPEAQQLGHHPGWPLRLQ
jgi:WD40 repeat protein/serine/threonine protein kinase